MCDGGVFDCGTGGGSTMVLRPERNDTIASSCDEKGCVCVYDDDNEGKRWKRVDATVKLVGKWSGFV